MLGSLDLDYYDCHDKLQYAIDFSAYSCLIFITAVQTKGNSGENETETSTCGYWLNMIDRFNDIAAYVLTWPSKCVSLVAPFTNMD